MRLLITGCTGFLGGNIGRLAAREGHTLLGVGRSAAPNVEWPGEYVPADLSSDWSSVIEKFKPEAVLHAAGPAAVGFSFEDPLKDLTAGLITWTHTLESVRRSKQRPLLLFPSSAAVYGNPDRLPVNEDSALAPISPYGFHKVACEILSREYAECFGLDIVIFRLFSVFGASQRRLLIWEVYQQLIAERPTVWLDGTGAEVRDYLDVDDVAEVILRLAQRFSQERARQPAAGRPVIVNIASGEEIEVFDLARRLSALVAPEKSICARGIPRPGEPQRWRADVSFLRSLLPAWRPKPFLPALSSCVSAWQRERFCVR